MTAVRYEREGELFVRRRAGDGVLIDDREKGNKFTRHMCCQMGATCRG
jgi:hypothetical protein